MFFKFFLILSFCLISTNAAALENHFSSNTKIDRLITKSMDVTGDVLEDQINLRVTGKNFSHPFIWFLEIKSKGEIIFHYRSDDSWLDKNFNDSGFVNDFYQNYINCKQLYYYHNLLDKLFVRTDLSANPHAFKKSNSGSIHYVVRKTLKETYNMQDKEISKIIGSLIKRLKTGKVLVMYVPILPVQSKFPIEYTKEINRFVTLYK